MNKNINITSTHLSAFKLRIKHLLINNQSYGYDPLIWDDNNFAIDIM